jgi:hypothetical protein
MFYPCLRIDAMFCGFFEVQKPSQPHGHYRMRIAEFGLRIESTARNANSKTVGWRSGPLRQAQGRLAKGLEVGGRI